ncbi:hypothetical protein Geu3261_0025_006 [Komagataeibacter europaeus NBRC 3261]|uniref:Uncharacterized protein n=1 Tax=Komagataeibacter europaeus NBRC 3261 TaxID=1234669 RepID=A0A0D6PXF5_KOMEU|nr:hypothetical protein [Komagataeibacter europaeus]GAN95450.1 hypothetical protein Geu3261_0025_006 [Komagataeibacter europaeus NBRC 3261]
MTRRSPTAMSSGATCQWIEGTVRRGVRPAFCSGAACMVLFGVVTCVEHVAHVFAAPARAADLGNPEQNEVSA